MPKLTLYLDFSPRAYENIHVLSQLPEYFDLQEKKYFMLFILNKLNDSQLVEQFKQEIEEIVASGRDIILSRGPISYDACLYMFSIIENYCKFENYTFQIVITLGRQDLALEKIYRASDFRQKKSNENVFKEIAIALQNSYQVVELCKKQVGAENLTVFIDKNTNINNHLVYFKELEKIFPKLIDCNEKASLMRAYYYSKQARYFISTFNSLASTSFSSLVSDIVALVTELENEDMWYASYDQSHKERVEFLAKCALNNKILAELYNNSEELFDTAIDDDVKETSKALTGKDYDLFVSRLNKETRDDLLLYLDTDPKIVSGQDTMFIEALKKTNSIELCRNYDEEYKLTVLTITHNHEKYLPDCIKSVQMQKTNFKVKHIVFNNFSTDNTDRVLFDFAKNDKNIFPVFRYEPDGKSTMSHLLNLATSEYVALCDGDDYFSDPLKLQKQVDLLEKNPSYSMCFHSTAVKHEAEPHKDYVYPPSEMLPRGVRDFYYLRDFMRANLAQSSSVMYRWRFRDGLPSWFNSKLVPGDWYWHLLHAEMGKIGYINDVMSVYRRHKASMYSQGVYEGVVNHRLKHGMKELECYDVINKHFQRKYEGELSSLASGVVANYIEHYLNTQDDSYINNVVDKYPEFAKATLSKMTIHKAQS